MKNKYFLGVILLLASLGAQAQYCTPPLFLSGPFTAIRNVSIGAINNETGVGDGYTDYTSTVDAAVFVPGTTVDLDWTLYYDPFLVPSFTGSVNFRVWIDWNQDEDFNDDGEEVIATVNAQAGEYTTFNSSFVVPEGALLGETRMRIYEDMLVEDGHEEPNPCGYDTFFGQHGECEDYAINVADNSSIDEYGLVSNLTIYPNPVADLMNIQFDLLETELIDIEVKNLLGETVYSLEKDGNVGVNNLQINTANFETGVYLISISHDKGKIVKKAIVG